MLLEKHLMTIRLFHVVFIKKLLILYFKFLLYPIFIIVLPSLFFLISSFVFLIRICFSIIKRIFLVYWNLLQLKNTIGSLIEMHDVLILRLQIIDNHIILSCIIYIMHIFVFDLLTRTITVENR